MQPVVITKVSISALVLSLPILYVSLLRLPPSALARDSTFWFLMSNSIMLIIAADSGVLFFGGDHSNDPAGDQSALVVHEERCDAQSLPLMALDEPPINISFVLGSDQLPKDGVASCMTTNTNEEDHAFASIKGEDDAARKPSTTNTNATTAKGEQQVVVVESEPNQLLVEEQMLISAPNASEEVVIVNSDCSFARAEPVTLVEEMAQQDKSRITSDDTSTVVLGSATEGSRRPEEREYWQLSDEELNRKVEDFITRFNRDMRLQVEQEAGD